MFRFELKEVKSISGKMADDKVILDTYKKSDVLIQSLKKENRKKFILVHVYFDEQPRTIIDLRNFKNQFEQYENKYGFKKINQ